MRSRADGHVRIGLERRGAKLVIEVEDTGEGLPESLRERIFEEGYSGRGSTGRGLPQARRVLESYGGAIRVTDGAPGQGTTFQILLNEGRRP
jgi:signal transduction histidine kinase